MIVPAWAAADPVTITFFLSLNMTGARRGQDPWEVWIYGGPTGMQPLAGIRGGDTNRLLTFTSSAPAVHMFRVFNGEPSNGIDNLTFDAAAVAATPEPGSILLFLSGFSAALVKRRRRDRH